MCPRLTACAHSDERSLNYKECQRFKEVRFCNSPPVFCFLDPHMITEKSNGLVYLSLRDGLSFAVVSDDATFADI